MPHGTHEHLEEAEHAEHASHDHFTRNVATTMVIIAAVLAAIAMLSHRSHTETLRLQTLSNVRHTQASDIWTYFQAKNIRMHQYALFGELTGFLATDAARGEQRVASEKGWGDRVAKYEAELPELEAQARELEKEADVYQAQSEHVHHQADRFDLGELCIELGLILASLAVLTRRKIFWFSGSVVAFVGVLIASSAWFLH